MFSMTRSERYLYLSHAESRKGQDNNRSRFLDEIKKYNTDISDSKAGV